ncbi:hypothetical protein B566_EDAN010860 [Ephemera danica]|nr:hypothetical protein B566_EDAN010860 [Ephemera danica]
MKGTGGIVCAVLGHDAQDGKFEVRDFCFATPKEHVYKPLPDPERLLVLVSGLGLGEEKAPSFAAELFAEWVCGDIGDKKDQERSSNIARVVLAGNSLQESPQDCMLNRKFNNLESDTQQLLTRGMDNLDSFLMQLLASVDVDIMPGEFDPGNHMLPQQPIHRCLLPHAFKYPTMHSVSNPYQCEVAGRLLLGTSGQPIKDMDSLCRQNDRLRLLQSCLEWGHISPSSPDTLCLAHPKPPASCFPCYTDDPFIMEQCPDILFAGNQPKFQTKLITALGGQAVRLVCIPSFSQTQTCVVVNLHTLDCYPMVFGDTQLTTEQ